MPAKLSTHVLDLAHTGPMDRPDGRLNAWILAWAGTALFESPGRVFDEDLDDR